jgi:4-hydroxythreonine-4-phosphate dehydrogenase
MVPADPRPWIALTLGDPAGIGPEVVLRAVVDRRVEAALRPLVCGPAGLRPAAIPAVAADGAPPPGAERAWLACGPAGPFELGRPQAVCGRAALEALRAGARLARERRVAALVTAPVSKQALHLAGEPVEGQSELLARWDGAERVQMVAVAGALRVMLLTRHMPLAAALAAVTTERVLEHMLLFDEALRRWGVPRPHIALAGLNPHAGEGGLLGSEEQELLAPAIDAARARGIDASGPHSPDTVFARAARGAFDGVLALYHDQAFIPVKLLAPDTGLTVLAGLSYLRVSPAHGTAFDIAGTGRASPENLVQALLSAAEWVRAGASAGQRPRVVEPR